MTENKYPKPYESKAYNPVELLEDYHKNLETIKSLQKTIDSLVKDKYTKYGDGYGFLATDYAGNKVWVNSVSTALEQKDERIQELETEKIALTERLEVLKEKIAQVHKRITEKQKLTEHGIDYV